MKWLIIIWASSLVAYWVVFSCFFVCVDFFKINFKNFEKNHSVTLSVSNSLDPDQARQFVGPDLGSNCLLSLSADDSSRLGVKRPC